MKRAWLLLLLLCGCDRYEFHTTSSGVWRCNRETGKVEYATTNSMVFMPVNELFGAQPPRR